MRHILLLKRVVVVTNVITIDTFPEQQLLSLKVFVDTKDAMGANMLNTILEAITAFLKNESPQSAFQGVFYPIMQQRPLLKFKAKLTLRFSKGRESLEKRLPNEWNVLLYWDKLIFIALQHIERCYEWHTCRCFSNRQNDTRGRSKCACIRES